MWTPPTRQSRLGRQLIVRQTIGTLNYDKINDFNQLALCLRVARIDHGQAADQTEPRGAVPNGTAGRGGH